jgi:hypothetical protein
MTDPFNRELTEEEEEDARARRKIFRNKAVTALLKEDGHFDPGIPLDRLEAVFLSGRWDDQRINDRMHYLRR